MKLETERLVLRPGKISDAKRLYKLVNDLEISKWTAKIPYPYPESGAKAWLKKNSESWKNKDRDECSFVIELKGEGFIGGMTLCHINKSNGTGEVGYWIGREYHGRGYGTEALRAVVDFAFNKVKLRRLDANVFPGNPSSGRLLEKLGFKQEGLQRKAVICSADGKIKDAIMYGLLKEEYSG